jgi:hypothetical protein
MHLARTKNSNFKIALFIDTGYSKKMKIRFVTDEIIKISS